MIWFIIAGIITLIIGFYYWSQYDLFEGFFCALLIGAFLGIFALIIGMAVGSVYQEDPVWVNTHTTPIVALADGQSAGGSFFLGIGSVKNEQRYFYYAGSKEGGYAQHSIPVTDATIYEIDDLTNPRVEKWEDKKKLWSWFGFKQEEPPHYHIYVPTGSIKQQFILDLN